MALLSKYRLTAPSLDNLVFIAEDHGFEIIDYHPQHNPAELQQLIDKLKLNSLIISGKTFTFQNNSIKLIFINEQMDEADKLYALAHELGHIVCGHLQNGVPGLDVKEELAANEFAHYLLRAPAGHKLKIWLLSHKAAAVTAALLIIAAIAAALVISGSGAPAAAGDYYVTSNGERYHERSCITIRDKDNVRLLTEEDLASGKYSPCQICLPQ